MKNNALDYIKQYNMIEKGDSITIGFSGGADSTALLHLLWDLRDRLQLTLKAVHLNHSIRGEESDRDEAFAKELAGKFAVPFFAEKKDIPATAKRFGISIEEAARQERYNLFARYTDTNGKVATAHTLSDSGETLLLNLTRGTALSGLTGIPPVRDNIIRPLLNSTRLEIEEYCAFHNLSYCTDSTNLTALYSRNKIRLSVVPVLKEINPQVESAMGSTMKTLLEEENYLAGETEKAVESLETTTGYNIAAFFRKHPALQNRVLAQLLSQSGIEVSARRIGMMKRDILEEKSGLELKQNQYLHCEAGSFIILRLSHKPLKEKSGFSFGVAINKDLLPRIIPLNHSRNITLAMVECKEFENIANSLRNGLKNLLDCDKIGVDITVRTRKPSDYFSPYGRNVGKNLKKLFNEAKIPLEARGGLAIVESEGKIAYVEGFGSAQWAAVDENTKNALLITFEE